MIYILTFLVLFVSSVLSGIAGGGGALIGIPYLIAVGIDPVTAIGTNKAAGLGISIGSLARFRKEGKLITKKLFIVLVGLSSLSAFLAPHVTFALETGTVRLVVGILIISVAVFMMIPRIESTKEVNQNKRFVGYCLFFVITALQAAFGGGVGALMLPVFMALFGMSAISANKTRRVVALPGIVIAATTFIVAGNVNFAHAAAVFAGSVSGGYVGSHIAVKKGDKSVKYVLITMSLVMGIYTLIGP